MRWVVLIAGLYMCGYSAYSVVSLRSHNRHIGMFRKALRNKDKEPDQQTVELAHGVVKKEVPWLLLNLLCLLIVLIGFSQGLFPL